MFAFQARGRSACLVVSGHLGRGSLRRQIERDGIPFLRKPVSGEELLALLNDPIADQAARTAAASSGRAG